MITANQVALDSLFRLYLLAALLVGGVVFLIFLYFLIRYRFSRGMKEPEDAPRAGVIPPARGRATIGLILAAVLFLIFIPITLAVKNTVYLIEKPPAEDLVIKVEGFQFGWLFTYPNGKQSVGELIIPKDKVVVLKGTSKDVFHNFYIPDMRVMIDIIPGKTNMVWIKALKTGSFPAYCNELCGVGHTFMKATVTVKEVDEFESFLRG